MQQWRAINLSILTVSDLRLRCLRGLAESQGQVAKTMEIPWWNPGDLQN